MTETDLILQWSLAAMVGFILLRRGQLTLFHPTTLYLAFHVVAFCIRPTLIYSMDLDSMWKRMEFTPEPEHLRLALLASSAALVTFAGAFSLFSIRAAPLDLPETPDLDSSEIRALAITAIVFVPLGIYAIASEDATLGSGTRGFTAVAHGYAGDLRLVLMPIALLLLIAARWRWWGYLPFLACVAFRDHQGAGLWIIILSVLLLVIVWLWNHRQLAPSPIAMIGGAMLIVLAVIAAQNRNTLQGWLQGGETHAASADDAQSLAEQLDRPDLAAFECLAFAVATVPEKTKTYSLGTQHLAALSWLGLDRLVGDTADGGAPRQIELSKYGNIAGLQTSLAADGWISGGWTGLVLTMALVGGGLGFGFSIFTRNLRAAGPVCFFLIIHGTIAYLYHDSTAALVPLLLFTPLPLVSWGFLASRMRAARAADEERQNLRGRREQRRVLGHAILNPDAAVPAAIDTDDSRLAAEDENESETPGEAEQSPDAAPQAPQLKTPSRPQARWRDDKPS